MVPEYLLILSYLRPAIEAELPGIQIYLHGKDELLPPGERILGESADLTQVAYVRKLECDFKNHPVELLLNESNIQLTYWTPPQRRFGDGCFLCPEGIMPTKSLTSRQIELAKCQIGPVNVANNFKNAGWVVGVEGPILFQAAMLGIRTTLIPTGLGTSFYKKLFPTGEIMSL